MIVTKSNKKDESNFDTTYDIYLNEIHFIIRNGWKFKLLLINK